ncbi:MAG: hypothetical protein VX777_07060 [Chlamydiota bacterium]|nr:hypothetical protein [Chlamydiota bacterium]
MSLGNISSSHTPYVINAGDQIGDNKTDIKSDLDTTIERVSKLSISSQPNDVSNEDREEKPSVSTYNSNPSSLTQEIINKYEQIISVCENVRPAYEQFCLLYKEILENDPDLKDSTKMIPHLSGNKEIKGSDIIEISDKLLSSLLNWSDLSARVAQGKLNGINPSSESDKIKDPNTAPEGKKFSTSMKLTVLISGSYMFLSAFRGLFKNSDRFEDLNKALISLLNSIAKPLSEIHELVTDYKKIFPYLKKDFIDDSKSADIIIALLPIFIQNCTIEELTTLNSLILSEKSLSYLSGESIQAFNTMISNVENSLYHKTLNDVVKNH